MIWTGQSTTYPGLYSTPVAPDKIQHDTLTACQPQPYQNNTRESTTESRAKRKNQSSKFINDEEKRKNFLERNRQAALKCRQRKKQWLNNLQAKIEFLTHDNEQLQVQANVLQEEILNLRTLLVAHKECHPNKQALEDLTSHNVPLMPVNSNVSMMPAYMPTSEERLGQEQQQSDKVTALMPNPLMYYYDEKYKS